MPCRVIGLACQDRVHNESRDRILLRRVGFLIGSDSSDLSVSSFQWYVVYRALAVLVAVLPTDRVLAERPLMDVWSALVERVVCLPLQLGLEVFHQAM